MPSVDIKLLSSITKAYKEGLSVMEIAKKYNVTLDAMFYFMRKHKIPRRNMSEQRKVLFSRKPLSYKIKSPLTKQEEILKALGVALYWAEGYKTEKAGGIDLANSDAELTRVFLKFLRDICQVDESRFRILLYCHDQLQIPRMMKYWSEISGIPPNQFSKPYVAKFRNAQRVTGMPNGLIHVRYCDKKLLLLLLKWIEEYKLK